MSLALLMSVCLLVGTSFGIPQPDVVSGIEKRASCGPSVSSYSLSFKSDWLAKHNSLRAGKGQSALVWDDALAKKAQELANTCVFAHDLMTPCNGGSNYGQNIYVTARSNAGATADLGNPAVQNWYDEINDYNYDDNKCSAVCGHYTQVVWSSTTKVGCAAAKCGSKLSHIFTGDYASTFLVVCNYDPAGNVNGARPY